MAVFTCPQCGHSQAVEDKHIGKNATCPKCKTQSAVKNEARPDSPLEDSPVEDPPMEDPPVDMPTERRVRSRDGGLAGVFWGLGPVHDYHPGSSITLEWIVADDPALKLYFPDVCGPKAVRKDRQTMFTAEVEVQCLDARLSAIDIHFLLFSVWGKHLTTLSGRKIRDFQPNERYKESMSWYASDVHADEYLASIGYVARVRTSEGLVVQADQEFILREAQRFSEKFTEEDLEPKSPKKE
jgi:hypothetical protein